MTAEWGCCQAAVWAAGLYALGIWSVLLAALSMARPRDGEGPCSGLATGVGLALLAAAVWYVSAECRAG